MSGTVRTDLIVFHNVGSEICRVKIQGTRDCASVAKLSIFITLLTVPYLRQQYMRFHGNTGYLSATQC